MKPLVDDQDDRESPSDRPSLGTPTFARFDRPRRAGLVTVAIALVFGVVAATTDADAKPAAPTRAVEAQDRAVAVPTRAAVEPIRAQALPQVRVDQAAVHRALEREAALERERVKTVNELPFEPIDMSPFFPRDRLPRLCVAPDPVGTLDVHRSLFVHDQATLTGNTFSLTRTLQQLAQQITNAGVAGVTAQTLFRDLWDTQATAAQAVTPEGAHCDANGSTINGFPNSCPRPERNEALNPAINIGEYVPVALVNRLDLAHEGWRNCGEHRIIYAHTGSGGRNFIIFEAVLPNPSPGCKDGCRPVAEFWAGLSSDNDAASRATKLETFFYTGLTGFRPVVHVDHYSSLGASSGYGTAGGGQIRTNQFLGSPWTLKEFRTLIDCGGGTCEFQFVPDTVKLNPFSRLWSPSAATTDFDGRVGDFRAAIATQVDELGAGTTPANLSYGLENAFNGAQSDAQNGTVSATSPTQGDTAYCAVFGCSTGGAQYLESALDAFNAGPGDDLTARQIVNRATALSCGGCHSPGTFGLTSAGALGPTTSGLSSWPNSAPGGFVHVTEQTLVNLPNPAVFGGTQGFALSSALTTSFLPARQAFLETFLGELDCPCAPRRRPPFDKVAIDVATLDRLLRTTPPPRRTIDVKTSVQVHALDRELEKAIIDAAVKAGVKVQPIQRPLTEARVEQLTVTRGLTDAKAKALARNRVIATRVSETPPRRTVTGSFRVH